MMRFLDYWTWKGDTQLRRGLVFPCWSLLEMQETHGNKVDGHPVTFVSSQFNQRCTAPDLGRAFAQFQQARYSDPRIPNAPRNPNWKYFMTFIACSLDIASPSKWGLYIPVATGETQQCSTHLLIATAKSLGNELLIRSTFFPSSWREHLQEALHF